MITADELARAVRAGQIPEGSDLARWVGVDRAIELYAAAAERGNIPRSYTGPARRTPLRPVNVMLAPQTRATIQADLWRHVSDHVETGGAIHGSITDTAIMVTHATVWPDDATRAPNHLTYRLGDAATDPTFIGTWHSHRNGTTVPSDEDLIDATELLRDLAARKCVLFVAAYDGHAALARGRYDLAAYIVNRDPFGDATYETAAIR